MKSTMEVDMLSGKFQTFTLSFLNFRRKRLTVDRDNKRQDTAMIGESN